MKPYEPLMVEHDLIKKMFKLINKEVDKIEASGKVNPQFVDIVSDFFITYVDVAHHGKEENILFAELVKKRISIEDSKIMQELVDQHKLGRKVVEELIKSNNAYMRGDQNEVQNIISRFKDFVALYSKHVDMEDNDYFIKVMNYFSEKEMENIIQNFWRFDIKLIHEKYKEILELLENA